MSLQWRIIVFATLFIRWFELVKADEATPSIDELVQRVLAQEKADRQHQAGLEYSFTLTTEHYDASERKTSTQTVGAIAKAKANIEYSADLKTDASGATKTAEEASPRLTGDQALRAQLDLTKLALRF